MFVFLGLGFFLAMEKMAFGVKGTIQTWTHEGQKQ
jgi:hypothetical protein